MAVTTSTIASPKASVQGCLDPRDCITLLIEHRKQLLKMMMVACLQCECHLNLLQRQCLHRRTIIHLPYIDVLFRNTCQELLQLAWSIRDQRTQDGDASLLHQTLRDEAAKQVHVDIATREEQHDLFADQVQQPWV